MGKPARTDRPYPDLNGRGRPLRNTSYPLRRSFNRVDRTREPGDHQVTAIHHWPGTLRRRATDGVRRKKLDVSRGHLPGADGSRGDFLDVAALRPPLRYAIQLFQE